MGRSFSLAAGYGFTLSDYSVPDDGDIDDIEFPKGVGIKAIGYLGEYTSEFFVYISDSYEGSWDYTMTLNPSYKPKASWDKLIEKTIKAIKEQTEYATFGPALWQVVANYG